MIKKKHDRKLEKIDVILGSKRRKNITLDIFPI